MVSLMVATMRNDDGGWTVTGLSAACTTHMRSGSSSAGTRCMRTASLMDLGKPSARGPSRLASSRACGSMQGERMCVHTCSQCFASSFQPVGSCKF